MLPYDMHVRFEEGQEHGALDGTVTVTVRETCTCRKLLLGSSCEKERGSRFNRDGQVKTLADWDEWRAGETYTYPFSLNAERARDLPAGIETEVHRIGELNADPAQVWSVSGQVSNDVENQGNATAVGESPVALIPAVQPVSLERDKGNADFMSDQDSTGAVTFMPAQELVTPGVEEPSLRERVGAWLYKTKARVSPEPILPATHARSIQAFNVAMVIGSLLVFCGAGTRSRSSSFFLFIGLLAVLLYLVLWNFPVRCRTPECTGRMRVERTQEEFLTEHLAYRCSECDDTYSATIFFIEVGGDWD